MLIGILVALLFWLAGLFLLIGIAIRVRQYWLLPVPLKIPKMPAPRSQTGVVLRMVREVLLFQSLFRADKLLWLLSLLMHYALLFVVLRHLRFFQEPVASWVWAMQGIGHYAAYIFVLSVLALLLRRIVIDRVRYISAPSDYFMLLLFLLISLTGVIMSLWLPTDIVLVKNFIRGLQYFQWQPLPTDPVLLIHLLSVAFLMIIFPMSKLMHAFSVWFSPSLNQVDNAREKRHITVWATDGKKPRSSHPLEEQ